MMNASANQADYQSKGQAPRNVSELEYILAQVHEQQRMGAGWRTNPATGVLEFEYAGQTVPQFYLVAKKGKVHQLQHMLQGLIAESDVGFAPTPANAREIWDMLDPSASLR
jgi:hypothetical protein